MPAGEPMLQPEPFQAESAMSSFAPGSMENSWNQQPPMVEANPNGIGPGCVLCGGGKCCPKSWYVDQRIRIMTHPKPRSSGLGKWRSTVISLTTRQAQFSYSTPAISTTFNLSASYEITLGRYLGLDTDNRNHFLEFTFYGTNRWRTANDMLSRLETMERYNITYKEYTQGASDPAGYPKEYEFESYDLGVFGNLFTNGRKDVAGFNRADSQSAEYSSSLNNFEVNLRMVPRSRADRLVLHKNGKWRRECQRGMVCSWLAGVRLLTLNENYDFRSHSTINYYNDQPTDPNYPPTQFPEVNTLGPPDSTNEAEGRYRVRTNNGLLGLQAGPEFIFRQCRAEFGMGATGAAYINFADQESWVSVTGAEGDVFSDKQDFNFHESFSRNNCAVSIQLDFNASYKVRPNFILKASYELLYIAGLALAPEQVNTNFNGATTINTGGSLLFQSGRLGFEYLW